MLSIFFLTFVFSLLYSDPQYSNEDIFQSYPLGSDDYYEDVQYEDAYSDEQYVKELSPPTSSILEIEKEEGAGEVGAKKIESSYFSRMYVEGFATLKATNKTNKTFLNWNGGTNAHLLANFYEAFLGFKGDEKSAIEAKNLAFRFSPLLMYYPKNKLSPALSFYVGGFKSPHIFGIAQRPTIHRVRPTTNTHFFPALNAIKVSKNKERLGSAIELSLPFFNFYFFWKTHENRHSFNIYSAYRNNELFSNTSKVNIALFSSFFSLYGNKAETDIKSKKGKQIIKKSRNEYGQIYGFSLNFESPFLYLNLLSLLSVAKQKKIDISSMSFRGEIGARYKIFLLNLGAGYKGEKYITESVDKMFGKKNVFSFYLQEKLKYKIFALHSSYHLFYPPSSQQLLHSYGGFYSINSRYVHFKNELFAHSNLYNLKIAFIIKPHLRYFSSLNMSAALCLQEQKKNPNIIKKYEVATSFLFPFGEHFRLKLLGGFSQEAQKKRHLLGRLSYFAKSSISILFRQEKWRESFNLSFKYKSTKQSEISLKFRLEY